MSRPKPSPPSLKTRLLALGLVVALGALGALSTWIIADAVAHGRIAVRHGYVVRAKEPVSFAIGIAIRSVMTATLLAVTAWLAWAATLAPPGTLRGRDEPRR